MHQVIITANERLHANVILAEGNSNRNRDVGQDAFTRVIHQEVIWAHGAKIPVGVNTRLFTGGDGSRR